MTELSVDYDGLAGDLSRPLVPVEMGQVLLSAAGDRYQGVCTRCSLVQFTQSGATYLFDFASAVDAEQEDRTVAAWAVTPAAVARRDVSYQRGFPLAADPGGPPVDRGHLIPHLSGGEFGPNIFRQDRALNRGWSDEGKRFRALEREAAAAGHLAAATDPPVVAPAALGRRLSSIPGAPGTAAGPSRNGEAQVTGPRLG